MAPTTLRICAPKRMTVFRHLPQNRGVPRAFVGSVTYGQGLVRAAKVFRGGARWTARLGEGRPVEGAAMRAAARQRPGEGGLRRNRCIPGIHVATGQSGRYPLGAATESGVPVGAVNTSGANRRAYTRRTAAMEAYAGAGETAAPILSRPNARPPPHGSPRCRSARAGR